MLASLAMYDGGALTAANDTLWHAIASRLDGAPVSLERERSLEDVWSSGRLLFGQICGYPFASRFRDRLRVIAAPHYDLPDCDGSTHCSYIVVSARSRVRALGELAGARAVINEPESMTGRQLLGDAFHGSFFGSVAISGSHAQSLAAIAAGIADVAAIDCVSYANLAPQGVRILHTTNATPTLPFVISTELGEAAARLVRRALFEAIADPKTAHARRVLHLAGVSEVDPKIYDRTLEVAARADQVFARTIASASASRSASRVR